MSRDLKALEVRFDNRLVGWLDNVDGTLRRSIVQLDMDLPTWTEEGEIVSPSAVECRAFKVGRVSLSIAADRLLRMGERGLADYVAKSVAPYAESYKDPANDSTRYDWRAVKLDSDEEYEWIFDHPQFVPVDTRPDLETIEATTKPSYRGVEADKMWLDEVADLKGIDWGKEAEPLSYDKYVEYTRPSAIPYRSEFSMLPIRTSDKIFNTDVTS